MRTLPDAYNKKILSEANKQRWDGTFLSVWTLHYVDGKIFNCQELPCALNGSPVRTLSEDDLENL